ncbi:reverse transcriptase domain-containing protein [Tanacetum coccineum]
MKLNPKKCTFGAEEGAFMGHVVSMQGIKACPQKSEALMKLQSPQTLKEAQTLNGKLASLNRFLSKSAEKLLPFFKTIKRCVKKSDFQWTPEAKRPGKHSMEKLVLALVHATRRLRRYFQAYPMVVIMDQPIKQIMSRPENIGRMLKWKFKLEAFDITYRPRTSIRIQVLVDFIAKKPDEEGPSMEVQAEEAIPEPWTIFTDESWCLEGSGAGLILTSPEGEEFTYALRFEFDVSNNEAKYEALVASLRIAEQMGGKNLIAKVDSRLVANQINGLYEAKEQSMTQYLEKLRSPHQTSLGRNAKKKVNRREGNLSSSGRRRVLLDDTVGRISYGRKSFLEPWMRCIGPMQAEYVVKEIHEGSCSMHFGLRSVVAKAIRSGYYWPTMHKDARNIIRKCDDCQTHRPVPMNPQQKLTPITSPWLFYKWGIDISGPFPEAQGKVKFLIVAIDYFTKLRLPGEIIYDNGKQFRDNPFKDWCEKLNIKQRNWIEEVPHVLWPHRMMIKTSNRDTPFSLTYGTEAVIPIEIGMPSIRCAEVNQAENDEELLMNLDILEERR